MLPVTLSRGALIAILACIFVLLGKRLPSILCSPANAYLDNTQLLPEHSRSELAFQTMLTKKVVE